MVGVVRLLRPINPDCSDNTVVFVLFVFSLAVWTDRTRQRIAVGSVGRYITAVSLLILLLMILRTVSSDSALVPDGNTGKSAQTETPEKSAQTETPGKCTQTEKRDRSRLLPLWQYIVTSMQEGTILKEREDSLLLLKKEAADFNVDIFLEGLLPANPSVRNVILRQSGNVRGIPPSMHGVTDFLLPFMIRKRIRKFLLRITEMRPAAASMKRAV